MAPRRPQAGGEPRRPSRPRDRRRIPMSTAPPPPATGTETSVLALRGITKTFGAVAALMNVDLDVAAGQVVAIVGDNGAGKSTLVKVLSGVHSADSGTIAFEGREVAIPTPAAAQAL